jgi:hypothetical protein
MPDRVAGWRYSPHASGALLAMQRWSKLPHEDQLTAMMAQDTSQEETRQEKNPLLQRVY